MAEHSIAVHVGFLILLGLNLSPFVLTASSSKVHRIPTSAKTTLALTLTKSKSPIVNNTSSSFPLSKLSSSSLSSSLSHSQPSLSQSVVNSSVRPALVNSNTAKVTEGGNRGNGNTSDIKNKRFYIEGEEEDPEPRFSIETFVTIAVTLMIVISNCTIVMVAAWTDAFHNFNKIFIYSMSLADLMVGLFVTPYSIFLSVYRKWVFAG